MKRSMFYEEVSENSVSVHFYYRLAWATRIQFVSLVVMRHNLWIGLSLWLSLVFILAFLTKPSFPGYVAVARANFNFDLLWFGFNSKTRSANWTFSLIRNHLFGGNKFGAKYLIQHFQNSLTRSCVLVRRCLGLILSSGSGWGGGRCCQ